MLRFSFCRTLFLVTGVWLSATCVYAEKLASAEIAKQGKSATAYVEVNNRGSGTAFCIHPSGLFVTNEHVVRLAGKEDVTLVLDPAQKTERIFRAKVIRADRKVDLALLHVEGAEVGTKFPMLSLGSVDGITELMDVVAFGYPLGRALSPDVKEYPAISINTGRVTALRMARGVLRQIQIDVALTFGNSGGPILNDQAKVIGVVVSGVRGAQGINQAIPVSHLEEFLRIPTILFSPPEVTPQSKSQPFEFVAQIQTVIPADKALDLELVLRPDIGKERRYPMKLDDGVYRVSAAVVPEQKAVVEVSAEFDSGSVSGTMSDREIQVNPHKLRLGECRQIQLGAQPAIKMHNGKSIKGMPTGLTEATIQIGDQSISLDLSKARTVSASPQKEVQEVICSVIAREADKEVQRVDAKLRVAVNPTAGDPTKPIQLVTPVEVPQIEIQSPALASRLTSRSLPEAAADICVGGGGRFLVLHLPKLKKLAIFDVNEAKIVHYVPLTEDKIVFAAGIDKLVVGLTPKGIVERWNLLTGEKELSRAVPNAADVNSVLLGSASSGPVFVTNQFLDLATFRPLTVKLGGIPPPWSPVSADGTVYGGWKSNQSPTETTAFVLLGDELKRRDAGGVGHVVPGPDGRVIFTTQGPFTPQFEPIRGKPSEDPLYCIPATEGSLYMALRSADKMQGGSISIYLPGNSQPLVKDVGIAHGINIDGWDREHFGPWKRIFLVPRAELIVVFPSSNDRLDLHQFNLDQAMEASGLDYLLVTSQPPRSVRTGATFEYPLTVKSKHGGVKLRLESAPKGMEIEAGGGGSIVWEVPSDFPASNVDVILSVSDSVGQETFHTFRLTVLN